MTFLLDVNVTIALLDRHHVHHVAAQNWFMQKKGHGFATCPIVQNGFLRIVSHKSYSDMQITPAVAAVSLQSLTQDPNHVFWPDMVSLIDSLHVSIAFLGASATLTDTYLLALAAHNQGKLATFDRRLMTAAVKKGAALLETIEA
jgi:uncharacterized protein